MPSPKSASRVDFSRNLAKADALALAWFQEEGGDKRTPALAYLGKSSQEIERLHSLLKQSKHFIAKKNEVDVLRFFSFGEYANVLLLGLGKLKAWSSEQARQAGAALALIQKRARFDHVALAGDSVFSRVDATHLPYYVQAFVEGYLLAGYEFNELRKKDPDSPTPILSRMTLCGFDGEEKLAGSVERARVLAEAVNAARLLGDRPGNYMTPTLLAKEAQKTAKEVGLRCKVLGKAEIAREKMGLFLGVAKGSQEEPKLIVLEHRGGKKGDKPIALVGKGVTFDTGGISLKPASQMEDMKYDMMGAATVIAVCRAAAQLKLPVSIIGIVPATENMPSGSAQKPGDVARSLSGKTVEITNTDAEGRLILADALEYAQKHYAPQAIIDFATLTGAVVVALGTVCSGIMGNHPDLLSRVKESAEVTAERVWELPLYDEYEEDLKSHYADLKNSGVRDAGSSKGGIFLKHFVDSKYPWVHCDIAGAAYHRKDVNYHPSKYGSGVMIRLMVHLLENWKPLS